VTLKGLSESKFFRPALGAVLAIICGLALWIMPVGEKWENASYDYLFRFGTPAITNNIVVILMDNDSYAELGQSRDTPWDRSLHAQLLNKLADDACPLVVFDVRFLSPRDANADKTLAAAMHRLNNIVLAAGQAEIHNSGMDASRPILPVNLFLSAARTNWGVAWLDPIMGVTIRRHWPFPNPGPYPSMPWVAATISGAHLSDIPMERWIRYYDFDTAVPSLSYRLALKKYAGYFRDKIVFIGNEPQTTLSSDPEDDKFSTPYTRWTNEAVGGVKILATSYLNLVRSDWLRRMAWPVEGILLIVTGACLGIILSQLSRGQAVGAAIAAIFFSTAIGVGLSDITNYWFPWLIVTGGQIPCALAWAIIMPLKVQEKPLPVPKKTIVLSFPEDKPPDAPDYELLQPPIGEGSFGKVWIVRNAIGQWQALKAVYQSKFGENRHPYESEFKGLQKYKPVSEKHPGLLRIDLVSKMKDEGYFYYIMELGDAQASGWEKDPTSYKPRDLENMRKQSSGPLPLEECIRIGTVLTDALNFLHSQGLTHRDIKPSNVIFVNDRPKLADIGLVTDIRPPEKINTFVGTPGYMPPPPEPTGTPQADIYAMGMVLYVISTGYDPKFFPDIATTIMERREHADFVQFDRVVLKACQPDIKQRYQTASDMLRDLEKISLKPGAGGEGRNRPHISLSSKDLYDGTEDKST
jgi:CHASE2 domain-containing sensor protein